MHDGARGLCRNKTRSREYERGIRETEQKSSATTSHLRSLRMTPIILSENDPTLPSPLAVHAVHAAGVAAFPAACMHGCAAAGALPRLPRALLRTRVCVACACVFVRPSPCCDRWSSGARSAFVVWPAESHPCAGHSRAGSPCFARHSGMAARLALAMRRGAGPRRYRPTRAAVPARRGWIGALGLAPRAAA